MIPCLLLLPAALLLDILFGDPPNRRHPVCLIGWCARRLEPEARRLWGGSFKAGMLAALGVCCKAWRLSAARRWCLASCRAG